MIFLHPISPLSAATHHHDVIRACAHLSQLQPSKVRLRHVCAASPSRRFCAIGSRACPTNTRIALFLSGYQCDAVELHRTELRDCVRPHEIKVRGPVQADSTHNTCHFLALHLNNLTPTEAHLEHRSA
jgi:hypothetical protein